MRVTASQIKSATGGVELRDFETVYIHFDRRAADRPVELVLGFRHRPTGVVSMLRFINPVFGDRPSLPFMGDEVYHIADQSRRGWEAPNRIEVRPITAGDHQMIHWWAEDVQDAT